MPAATRNGLLVGRASESQSARPKFIPRSFAVAGGCRQGAAST